VPGVFRVAKPAYLKSGFVALSNWHQDPGYGAAWANLWAVLALIAGARRPVSGRWWLDGVVIGGLAFTVVMAFSRTGWLVLPLAMGVASWMLVRHGWISFAAIGKRLLVGAAAASLLVGAVFLADVPDRGGDLELQFSFRFSQGFDLLASITGLFEPSERFADAFDFSEERADVWPEYLEMFRGRPWTGVGLSVGWQTNSIGQEPHNLVLELLAETGLVGMGAFLIMLVLLLVKGGGVPGRAALFVSLLPFMTQTVLFEPAWWFAAGLLLVGGSNRVGRLESHD
jgi:O-antigen ligase